MLGVVMADVGSMGVDMIGVAPAPGGMDSGGVGRWLGGDIKGGDALVSDSGGVDSSSSRFSFDWVKSGGK